MGGLHEAASRGHVKTVLDLLEKGAEINSKDNDGRTPMHLAAREGRDDTVECLVEQGAKISITDDHGMTPLHLAAERARVKVIEYLVGREADIINIQDRNRQTALHIAAKEGRDDTVECLVEQGAKISITDKHGMTPLHLAAERARVKVIEYLVGREADIINIQDLSGQTALHIAASKGRGFTVKCLVNQGANTTIKDKNEKTPLDVAVESDSVESAEFLLSVPGVKMTYLRLAFEGGHMNTVKYLVDKRADINTKYHRGMTHLHLAVQGGHMNTVTDLVNNRADINTKDDKGWTPLHMAASEGYDSIVKFLVEEGADINMGDCDGWTPLHVAAKEGYEITVQTLVCKNADIDIKDEKGMTPLHVAAKSARFKVVECLVDQGANISTKDNNEVEDHLELNFKYVDYPTVLVLLDFCARNILSVQRTPLHTAAAAGYVHTVKHLVKRGADINIKDNSGKTALDLADEEGHMNVSEFLKEAGRTPMEVAAESDHMNIVHYFRGDGISDEDYNISDPETGQVTEEKAGQSSTGTGSGKEKDKQIPRKNVETVSEQVRGVAQKQGQSFTVTDSGKEKDKQIPRKNVETVSEQVRGVAQQQVIQSGESEVQTEKKLDDSSSGSDTKQMQLNMKIKSLEAEIEKLRRQLDQDKPKSREHSLKTVVDSVFDLPGTPRESPEVDDMDEHSKDYLRGLNVIGEISVLITSKAQTFHWVGYGLKIHIPQGVLPVGLKQSELTIKVGISGQFTFPQKTSLMSAVYWFHSEYQCEFSRPIIVEIQHCATSSQTSRLSFARCSHYSLPYNFEILEEGDFSLDAYGRVQLSNFSLIAVLKSLPLLTWIFGADEIRYHARVYYLWREENQRKIHFVITKDLEAHTTVIKKEYNDKGAIVGPHLPVEFEASSISLELPFEGVTLKEGWRLLPLFHPEITKKHVDSFETGQEVSSCQVRAEWTKQGKPSQLTHAVTLKGAKKPNNYFYIELDSTPPDTTGDKLGHDQIPNFQYENVDDTQLGEDDLQEVRSAVADLAGKWKDLGISLGVRFSDLEAIHFPSPSECLREMLAMWLKQSYNVEKFKKPTWRRLVKAVEDSVGGNNPALAQTIARKHPGSQ